MTTDADGGSVEEPMRPSGLGQSDPGIKDIGTASLSGRMSVRPEVESPSVQEVYRDRRHRIWRETTGRGEADGTEAWEFVEAAVERSGFAANISALPDRPAISRAAGSSDLPISGDYGTVNLLVNSEIQNLSPAELPAYIRRRMAPTIERLEAERATPEHVSDIIIYALRAMVGMPETTELSRRLLGYLGRQTGTDINYFMTVDMVGDLLGTDPDELAHIDAAIAYHLVVRGALFLIGSGTSRFEDRLRRTPSLTLASLAQELWRHAGDDEQSRAARMAFRLRDLSAVVAETPRLDDPELAGEMLTAMDLPASDPLEYVGALNARLRLNVMISGSDIHLAISEAFSSPASALCGDPELVPRKLFNCGVSLIRAQLTGLDGLRARLTVNLMGLYWATMQADPTQLESVGGYSCAVNFAGAAAELSQSASSALWTGIVDTVRAVTRLTAILTTEEVSSHRARLGASARSMKMEPDEPFDPDAFDREIRRGLMHLTDGARVPAGAWTGQLGNSAEVLTLAAVVRWVFVDLLGESTAVVDDEIGPLVQARADAVAYFLSEYGPLVEPDGAGIGRGPLVEAGLISRRDWDARVQLLLRDQGPMAPVLRNFRPVAP